MKHTPGPWNHDDKNKSITALDQTVCTLSPVYDDDGFDRGTVSRSNARLIAAAPEMLEMLERMTSQLVPLGNDDEILVRAAIEVLRKARG